MTLHLKDRAIEQKLNELSNGEFSKILNKEADTKNGDCLCFTIDKKEDIELSVFLRPEAIEPEYDPHKWNEYPAVTPPEGVLMRVECFYLIFRKLCRTCAIFCNGQWFVELAGEADTEVPLENTMIKVKRFRPWED